MKGTGVISDYDLYLFGEGKHTRIYDKLGAHPATVHGEDGVHFAVWAPNAASISVVGDFNSWDAAADPMMPVAGSGLWEAFVPRATEGQRYKFHLRTRSGFAMLKADPYGFAFEAPPGSASIVCDPRYDWADELWMKQRPRQDSWFRAPLSAYEVHLGSWARVPEEGNRSLTYRELATRLIPYVKQMGYTHIELMPVM